MSGNQSSVANYSGRQPDLFQNIKQFFTSTPGIVYWFYKTVSGTIYITPADQTKTVLIPKDLFVGGSITNTADVTLKQDIEKISNAEVDRILDVRPVKYSFIGDETSRKHYGVIAQDLDLVYPELVRQESHIDGSPDIKSVNYIGLIPILICKIQQMQKEIDELKNRT